MGENVGISKKEIVILETETKGQNGIFEEIKLFYELEKKKEWDFLHTLKENLMKKEM